MSERAKRFFGNLKFLFDDMDIADDVPSNTALLFFDALAGKGGDAELPPPFKGSVSVLHTEFDKAASGSRKTEFERLEELFENRDFPVAVSKKKAAETLWAALFPEALHLSADPKEQIRHLRDSRIIRIEKLAESPVKHPAKEILFTSNVLLSPPVQTVLNGIKTADENIENVIHGSAKAGEEKQKYWYDHPIPIGTACENDEAVYGLAGLAQALDFEKKRGNADADDRLQILLSVSVTHSGLHEWALPWLREQTGRTSAGSLEYLDVYAFTEDDAAKVVDLLKPWLDNPDEADNLKRTFGVDGEYGRHYSFLKALPALWSILIDSGLRATFKIDLDQVFPQNELSNETGKSAFEHFQTPLWGSLGKDTDGRDVELGMIAGGLVNEKDISSDIFTSDIPWPEALPKGEDLLFFKQRPMAVSTRSEIMTRYSASKALDGVTQAIQRIHVTGGTNGIRFDALRRHRPFTPSFIGRAEDQGYLLSVITGREKEPLLRYAHASGLLMRHDKEAFAAAAVKAGKAGSYVGDLIRLFVFSQYADILPGGPAAVKKQVDPFTGCFITEIPAILALLRLTLHLLGSEGGSSSERGALLKLAGERLPEWVHKGEEKAEELQALWNSERRAWDTYYNALNRLETALGNNDVKAVETAKSFRDVLKNCRII